jgi:MoaA/NifB/PqqE/SkfB family radical SAM enzyme
MYAFEEVSRDAIAFREAVQSGTGFRPLYVKIKLLFGCNLRCAMCAHWREPRPAQIPGERLVAILDELAGLGCRKVHFTGGEPGLRGDLERLVAHAGSLGLRVTLTTNGTLVTRQRARALVEAGLRGVNVSIDSPEREVHDAQRGVPGSFEAAVEGAKNFAKEARHGKLSLSLNTVVTRLNWRTLGGLPRLAAKLGARRLRLLPVDDHLGAGLRPSRDEIDAFNREISPRLLREGLPGGLLASEADAFPFGRSEEEVAQGARGEYANGHYRRKPCFAPFTHALVDHDGMVSACCNARKAPALGALHEQPFAAVWSGAPYAALRRSMLGPEKLPACHRCDDFRAENRRLQEILEA